MATTIENPRRAVEAEIHRVVKAHVGEKWFAAFGGRELPEKIVEALLKPAYSQVLVQLVVDATNRARACGASASRASTPPGEQTEGAPEAS